MSTEKQAQEQHRAGGPERERHIYTKFGDAGQTMLVGKQVVGKDSARVNVYGTLDEATSALGMARASTADEDIRRTILDLQGELIEVMAELATAPGAQFPVSPVGEAQVERLERLIDGYEKERIATKGFVRPGGSLASAALDLARTIVRRAERSLVTLSRAEEVSPALQRYFNRLSDLLYMMARIDEQRQVRRAVEQALQSSNGQVQSQTSSGHGKMEIDFLTSHRMMAAGMKRALEIGVPMVLAVTDASGFLVSLVRMDGARLVSVTLAPNKAYTAVTVRVPTHDLARLAQPGESLYSIQSNLPNLTIVGGGLPLVINDVLVGGVGVSGGSVEQDIDVAQAMAAALIPSKS